MIQNSITGMKSSAQWPAVKAYAPPASKESAREIDNGASKEYDIGFVPTTLEVTCSTGELELNGITFTR